MIESRKAKLQSRLINYVVSRHKKIEVKPKQGLFNFRCYWNAVEYAKNHKNTTVVEVMYVDEGRPILHYINKNLTTGEYLETSLGYMADAFDYYEIRDISEDDYYKMLEVFTDAIDSWLYQFTNWFDRNILRIERLV